MAACCYRQVKSSQVKSSSGATRPRGDHPDPNFFLPPSILIRGLWRGLSEWGRPLTVKSSQVVGLRDRVAIIRAPLHAISSPQAYAGYGQVKSITYWGYATAWRSSEPLLHAISSSPLILTVPHGAVARSG